MKLKSISLGVFLFAVSSSVMAVDGYKGVKFGSSVNEQNQPMKRYEDWQNSVMVIHDYGKGHYEFENVMIQQDGKIYYQGKVFG